MKKVLVYVFGALAVVLLLIALKFLSGYFFQDSSKQGLTLVSPKVNVLIIDDPGQTPAQLFQHLEEGQADLLLWIDENHGEKQAYTFNTLESLVRLEKNHLGFLESKDEELDGLNVAQYDAEKRVLYYMSAKAAHISTIEVSRNYLVGEVLSDPEIYKESAGVVVYSNGAKKELRMIRMPQAQIEEAKLAVAQQVRGK